MRIVAFSPELAPAFSAINREWIESLFVVEPADSKVLDDPYSTIIASGGQIFFVLAGDEAVGTVAAIKISDSRFELAKMAVAPSHQGHGLGWLLGQQVIAWVRKQGAKELFLVTHNSLRGAIRLYERLGFIHGPLPAHTEYVRANVYMELQLVAS